MKTKVVERLICDVCLGNGVIDTIGDSGIFQRQCTACAGKGDIERDAGEVELGNILPVIVIRENTNG